LNILHLEPLIAVPVVAFPAGDSSGDEDRSFLEPIDDDDDDELILEDCTGNGAL